LGPSRWISAVIIPDIFKAGVTRITSAVLNAFTSDPPCTKAVVRVSHEAKSGIFRSQEACIQSKAGLKVKDVNDAVKRLRSKLKRGTGQALIKRELRTFMPGDIHPVTTQEWKYVRSLQAKH